MNSGHLAVYLPALLMLGMSLLGLKTKCLGGRKETTMPEEKDYVKKLIRVDFTQDELLELGLGLTEQIAQVKSFEAQKIAAAADFTSRIKQANLRIDSTMQKISDRFEIRQEECLIEYDHALNMVHYIFEHNGQRIIVEQRKMTADEKQIGLGFEGSDSENIFDELDVPDVGV